MKRKLYFAVIAIAVFASGGFVLNAATQLNAQMQNLVNSYKTASGSKAFSAEEGKKLFHLKKMHTVKKEERSCTTCHAENPASPGRTAVGKAIDPISPAVSKGRFTDPAKVEKWFQRNCTWVLERECTPKEKGDFIAYMISL